MDTDTFAVSEIIGAVLLLAITIGIFSVVYVSVLSAPVEEVNIAPVIMGQIIQTNVILEHQGGVSLLFSDISIDLESGTQQYSRMIIDDHNENGYWDIGDRIIYEFDTIENETITVTIVDTETNIVLLTGVLQEGYPVILQTYVEPFSVYEYTSEPVTVTALNLTPVSSINLWYQYSDNNITWSSWTDYSNLTNESSGWECEFPFPEQYGYYRFYSIGHYEGQSESPPSEADAACFYNPPFTINTSVNTINPYDQEQTPLVLNATGDRRLNNVTLYYRYSTDNSTWDVSPETEYQRIGEVRIIENVDHSWKTVDYWNTYTNPVIVCINDLASKNNPEVCVRMSNVTSSSCDIKLQNPGNLHTVVPAKVYLMIIEEGIHNLSDGRHLEAWTFTSSTQPDYKGANLPGTNRGYSRFYNSPRVFAQVMSYNDPRWSVPLLTDGDVSNPPDASALYINRQVGEDPDRFRDPETMGYIVIEAGSGINNDMSYSVERTSDSIDGVANNGVQYLLGGTYSTGIASLVGLDGGDGGWAVLMGTDPISSYIWLGIDEDTLSDSDRGHTKEEVDYWVFSTEGNITSNLTQTVGQWMQKWNSTNNPATQYPWSWNFTYPNGSGYYEFYSIGANTSNEESPPSQADARCYYNPINTSVNQIIPHEQDSSPVTLTATGENWLSNVTLYYRYSTDNSTWDHNQSQGEQHIGEVRIIENVDHSWTTVDYWNTYTNPVIVCINDLASKNDPEVCIRMSNVTSTTCDIKLQNPGNHKTVVPADIYLIILEEGIHNLSDGRHLEAWAFLSTTPPDHDGAEYVGTNRGYVRTYTNPRVLAQVMSYNDSRWSVPLLTDGNENTPPDASNLYINTQVAEDPDTTRLPEIIGYIVIEAGSGTNNNMSYQVNRTTNSIDGTADNGNTYPLDGDYSSGVASMVGLNGANGGWAVLMGSDPISTTIWLAIDEDTIMDTDRSHTDEEVDFWVFSAQGNITSNISNSNDQWMQEWNSSSNPSTNYPWSWQFNFPNGTGYYEFYSIGANETLEENPPDQADARCFYNTSSQPISLWYFNENTGTMTYDAEDVNNGTIYGATWVTGINRSCLRYNGSSDYVEVPASTNLDFSGTQITIEAWVNWETNPNVQTKEMIVYKGQNDSWHPHYNLMHTTTRFGFGVITENAYESVYSATIIEENTWYYLVGTYNGTHISLYVDGVNERTEPLTGNMKTSLVPVYFGSNEGSNHFFKGKIDNVAIYNSVLSSSDILERYNSTKPVITQQNISAQWQLDNGTGTIAYDTKKTYNGTIHSALWTEGIAGKAISFDGTNGYISMDNSQDFIFASEMSIEVWAKPIEHKTAKIIQKGDWDGTGIGQDIWDGWKAHLYIQDDQKYNLDWGLGRPDLNEWYHIVITYNGSIFKLFVNAEVRDNISISGSIKENTRLISIASDAGSQKFFNGVIDEATIYKKALTSQEVQKRYELFQP